MDASNIDLRRLWWPAANLSPSQPPRADRKACRQEVKKTLKLLEPFVRPADAVTRRWLAARCETCRSCPKMLVRLNITPP